MGLEWHGRSGKRTRMRVARPIAVQLPKWGVKFAESAHGPKFRMAERADPFHKVLYVLAGQTEFRCRSFPHATVSAGTALLVPAGAPHRLRDLEPATVLLLCFSRRWLSVLPELAPLWRATVAQNKGTISLGESVRIRIEALWRRALFEQIRQQEASSTIAFACAAEIVALLTRVGPPPVEQRPAERIHAVAAEVANSFMDNWRLDDAARRAGMSRRSFTAHFRATLGKTFWEHLEDLRIAHADQLFERGEHTILGVMFSAGFNDVSTFYRAFRRKRGVSPKQRMKTLSERKGARPNRG
ncbi:MAG: hypothetical protein C0518_01920 [Opitutus sp.]|nr:hypothetical protein [Opitutus sp.]